MKQISYGRKLRYLSQYMDEYIDSWPKKIKTFDRWLESTLDKRAHKGKKKGEEYFKQVCRYCKRQFDVAPTEKTKDHIVPLSKGGYDNKFNRVPCCKECNTWKDNKFLGDWIKEVKAWIKSGKEHPIFSRDQLGTMLGNIKAVEKYAREHAKKISLYKF